MMMVEREAYTFYVKLSEDARALILCEKIKDELHVLKSSTPEEWRGRGIATMIMQEVVKYANANKLKVVPECSFAVNYCSKNKC